WLLSAKGDGSETPAAQNDAPLSQEEAAMLADAPIFPSLPAHDIDRAKAWYEEKLGLKPTRDLGPGGQLYTSGKTLFVIYPTRVAKPATAKIHQTEAKAFASSRSLADTGRCCSWIIGTTIGNAPANATNEIPTSARNSASAVPSTALAAELSPERPRGAGVMLEAAVTMGLQFGLVDGSPSVICILSHRGPRRHRQPAADGRDMRPLRVT